MPSQQRCHEKTISSRRFVSFAAHSECNGIAGLAQGGHTSIMPKRSSKRQKDTQQLARSVLDAIAPDAEPAKPEGEKPTEKEKNPAAVALGRLGGLRGGKARAAKLSPAKRKAIAKKAAAKRWAKRGASEGL
jgi:hypothetical protein